MKKRIIALLLAVMMIATIGMVGCQKEEAKSNKVVMGLDDSFPPMGFRDEDQELVGFDIDLAKAVFEHLEMEVEFLPIDWNQKDKELTSKAIDLIWNGFTITEEGKETYQFSAPYLANDQVMVVREDSEIATLADLKDKSVAIQSGSSAEAALEKATDLKDSLKKVNQFEDNLKAFMDLEQGSSDAVLVDSIVANYYITENDKPFVVLEESLQKEEYGIGFRKDDELCAKVEKALKELKADGTVEEISTKWFGSDITTIVAE